LRRHEPALLDGAPLLLVAFPTMLVVLPIVRRIVARLVQPAA